MSASATPASRAARSAVSTRTSTRGSAAIAIPSVQQAMSARSACASTWATAAPTASAVVDSPIATRLAAIACPAARSTSSAPARTKPATRSRANVFVRRAIMPAGRSACPTSTSIPAELRARPAPPLPMHFRFAIWASATSFAPTTSSDATKPAVRRAALLERCSTSRPALKDPRTNRKHAGRRRRVQHDRPRRRGLGGDRLLRRRAAEISGISLSSRTARGFPRSRTAQMT